MDESNQKVDSQIITLPTPSADEIVNCPVQHNGRQLLNDVLPVSVDELFTIFFNNSKLYNDFQAHRKNTDIVQTPWVDDPNGKGKTRVVTLTAYTSQSFIAKTSKVHELQTLNPCSRAGSLYSISGETTMKGPPMAESFYIEMHCCMKKVSEKSCSVTVYSQVKYKKTVFGMMKGMIEKMTYAGLEEFWKEFCEVLKAEYEERAPETNKQRKLSIVEIRNGNTSFVPDFIGGPEKEAMTACSKTIILIFVAIFFLAILNVFLYNKLSLLEDIHQNHDTLKLQLLKNAPAPSDEWLNSAHKQNTLQTTDMKKWHDYLKKTIHSLKETENILTTLRDWTDERIGKINADNVQLHESTSGSTSQEL